ncbi:NIPA-like protein 2 [Anneissia japonica]|uniref:NIPA-like protein 2 n=1 Tax=Anneissia japonica TaxID=1529436 RepID=UPI0014255B50|nr:NIPA-like protein 2 [Anneissia japonica]
MSTGSGSVVPHSDHKPSKKELIIGGSLAIGGNLMISIAMNIQKYALMQLIKRGASEHDYTKSRLWWFGIVLMVFGELGNFMAYGFAPATTVAPLGTTTVLANAYIASLYLGEKVRRQDLLGTVVILVGVFLILTFSTSQDIRLDATQLKHHLEQWSFIFYVVVEAVIFVACIYLVKVHLVKHVALYLLPAAILASLTIIGAKAVSSMLDITFAGDIQLVYPLFYFMILLMVVTGVIQIRFVTKAMQEFDSTVVVPTNFVFFTISAILAGIFFYQEFMGLTYLQVTMFLYGCFFCFFGVGLIAEGRENHDASPPPTETTKLTDSQKIKQKTKDLVQNSDFSKHKVQPSSISTQSSSLKTSSSDEEAPPSPIIIFHFEMNQDQDQEVKGSEILFNPEEEIDGKTSQQVQQAIHENDLK